ncbi:hypothetical protein CVT26_014907 [Gymnopilus dilepis]|uniref:F-box domain-containing protein n=1 Tax=Gymnopilus dilepis TaxID=231916 RepID=A0A409XWU7_9AGAR|nr:hypothetical protein CVT26_014907 [Gymnopilus dilepis]
MQDIPYDVWLHIASFLGPEEVENLLTLNTMFLSIALDTRYWMAFIGPLYRRATQRSLNRLTFWNFRDPKIAPRVRLLTFRPGHLCMTLQAKEEKRAEGNSVSRILKRSRILSYHFRNALGFSRLSMTPDIVKKNLLKIMSSLTSLKSLRIEIRKEEHAYFNHSSEDFLAAGWTTFKDTLTSLFLRVPLEDLTKVLPPANDTLTSLKMLSFQIPSVPLGTDGMAIVKETLVPFINKHYRTLRALELDVEEQNSMSPLLRDVIHLPLLSSFKLKLWFLRQEQPDIAGLKHFFETHRHLTALDISVTSSYVYYADPFPFFSRDCFRVSLPKLQHLVLDLDRFRVDYREGFVPFIRRFDTLHSLAIVGHMWSFESLRGLIAPSGGFLNLRSLKIAVYLFTPLVLTTLEECLPTLESLCIGFNVIGPEGLSDTLMEGKPQFVNELDQKAFSSWHLRTLDFDRPLHSSPTVRQKYKAALVRALPNVRWFCGLSREEYVATSALI